MARQRKTAASAARSDMSIIQLVLNPVSLMIVVAVAAIPLWNRYHSRLNINGKQPVTAKQLHLNTPPPWIQTNLCEAAIRDSRLHEIAVEKHDSVELVAAALAVQPWIKSVDQIRKSGQGIFADVTYRCPVAIVEFADDLLVPVDNEAVVLESDGLSAADTLGLWRISIPQPLTTGLATGRVWSDLRVQDATAIASVWQFRNRPAGLMRVVNRSYPTGDRIRLRPYELMTAAGTVVFWGSPPGHEIDGEASPEEKISAIENFIEEHGPLDAQGIRILDVRDGTVRKAEPALAEKPADFLKTLK